MAKGIVLGAEAVRQTARMYRDYYRDYRNLPPATRRQPVYHGGGIASERGFFAQVYERLEIEIHEESDSEPNLCPVRLLPRLRGEYSAIEVEPDPHDSGTFRVKDGGRWMKAGTCSALRDINRSNAAIEVENMVVWVWEGTAAECESSSEQASSSSIEVDGHTGKGMEPSEIYYWMDLGTPREECTAHRYYVVVAADNDTPYV